MRPSKTAIQRRGRQSVDEIQKKERQKLLRADVGVIAGAAGVSLAGLIALAYFWINASSVLIPFVVGATLPLFTLFAVIYQAVVYRRQWHAMQDALRQTDRVIEKMQNQLGAINDQTEVMRKALSESEKMTAHAEKNLVIAQSGIEHAQRAYISVVKREFTETGFMLTIENTGNTPALEVAIDAIVKASDCLLKMPEELTDDYRPLGLLAPRNPEEIFFPMKASLTDEEQQYLNDPLWGFHWYCKGFIYYRDIFQQRTGDYWMVHFCFYYDQFKKGVRADASGNEVEEYRNGQKVKPN